MRAGKGARPSGARVRRAEGSALELRSGWSRRVPPAFPAGRDRKWWRPRGEVEAPWGRGPRGLKRPDRKRRPWGTSPGPNLSPTASHSQSCWGPLLPWAGRVRPLILAIITGIPAGGGSFILRRGRGQEARAPGRKRLGQGQAPCGPAVQDEEGGWACWRPPRPPRRRAVRSVSPHSWPQRWTHQFVEMSARRTRGVLQVQDDVIRQKSDPPAQEPAASVDAGSSVLGTKDRARSRPAETHTWKQNSPPCDQSPDG